MQTREESQLLVNRILNNDNKAFDEFYEMAKNVVHYQARKWEESIVYATSNLYDIDDIISSIWIHLWTIIDSYNPERGNLMTWVSYRANYFCWHLKRDSLRCGRNPELQQSSLQETAYDNDHGDAILRIDLLIDPKDIVSDWISEENVYSYVYALKHFISTLNQRDKIIFSNWIDSPYSVSEISKLLGVSQMTACRSKIKMVEKAEAIWKRMDNNPLDHEKVGAYIADLLSSTNSETLSEEKGYDHSTIIISRKILGMANLYRENPDK